MERVEGGPDFKKKIHISSRSSVKSRRRWKARNPTLRLLSLWGFLVESLMPLCKRGQDKWRKKGGKHQTPLPRPVRPSVRPSVGLSLPRPPPHTCELTHQVLQDKPTAHLRDRRPQSLYGDLEGVGGRRGGGPSVTDTLQSFFEVAYTSCPLPASGRGIFVTLRHSHHSLIP